MVNQADSDTTHVLVLGGSSEASRLARALARGGVPATFSYAGRVEKLNPQPIPTRVGGFGGVRGLVHYLREAAITHVVDATHPFASQMSRHAAAACRESHVPHVALVRPAWSRGPGDDWTEVTSLEHAPHALGTTPQRVFLAIGRQHVGLFGVRPQHDYLLRMVEPPREPVPLPSHQLVIARGPFELADELALMRRHAIDVVVSKNAGGSAARAKLDAARELGRRVIMVRRPEAGGWRRVESVDEALAWLRHEGVNLGV